MEVHPGMSYYNDVQDGTALVTKTLESTNNLTPLHIPPGPPMPPDRYEELRNTFQLSRPFLKAGQEYHGASMPVLPETHRSYEHCNYGSTSNTPPRLPNLPDNSAESASVPKHRSPQTQNTLLVECRFRPFHPYIHVSGNNRVNPYKYEDASEPSDTYRESIAWPGQHRCIQLPQSAEENGQVYDPNTPEDVDPQCRAPEGNISYRAANTLENVKKALWMSTYKRDYTGKGSMNPLLLDDYDSKLIGRATGEFGKDVELRETFPSVTSQVRPLEGRIARLLQGRRPHTSGDQVQVTPKAPQQQTTDSGIPPYSEGVMGYGKMSLRSNTDNEAKEGCLPQNQYQPQDFCQGDRRRQGKKTPHNRFQKITDTWKTEYLYQRQLAVPPEPQPILKPAESIYYEDLKPSRLDKYIVWHHPASLSKPASKDLSYEKHGNLQDLPFAACPEETPTRGEFPEWIPNCKVVRPQTKLLDIQNSFTKTEAIKHLNELAKGGMRDLRDHDREGRRHNFQGINAYFFH